MKNQKSLLLLLLYFCTGETLLAETVAAPVITPSAATTTSTAAQKQPLIEPASATKPAATPAATSSTPPASAPAIADLPTKAASSATKDAPAEESADADDAEAASDSSTDTNGEEPAEEESSETSDSTESSEETVDETSSETDSEASDPATTSEEQPAEEESTPEEGTAEGTAEEGSEGSENTEETTTEEEPAEEETEEESVLEPEPPLGENDFNEEGFTEAGSFNHAVGAKIPFSPTLIFQFAPSPEAQKAGSLSPEASQNLAAAKAQEKKEVTMGILTLKNIKAWIKKDGNPYLEADINVQDSPAKMTLHRMGDGEVLFKVRLTKDMNITVLPGKEFKIRTWYLLLAATDQDLYTRVNAFSDKKEERDTKLTLSLNMQDPSAKAECEIEVPLEKVIASAKDDATLKQVILTNITINLPNPLFPVNTSFSITVNCSAKLEHIKIFSNGSLPNSDCTISFAPGATTFSTDSDKPIIFDQNTKFNKPSIDATIMPGSKPEATISGILEVDFDIFKGLKIPCKVEKRADGYVLVGTLGNNIGFPSSNPIFTIGAPTVTITRQTDPDGLSAASFITTYDISGTLKLFGCKLVPRIRIMKKSKGGLPSTEFSATFEGKNNIKPLSFIPGLNAIPGLKDFELKDALIGLAKDAEKAFYIGGKTVLLGLPTQAKIMISKQGPALQASTTKAWHFSDSIPGTKGSPLDSIGLNSATIVLSSYSYFDFNTNMKINKGVNFFGDVDTSQGVFKNPKAILGDAMPKKIVCAVMTSPNPMLCRARLIIPLDIRISDKLSLYNIAFEVSGEPSMALLVALKFIPKKGEQPLIFTARIEFALKGVALAGTMAGFWREPFGFKGLNVGDVAIEIMFPYAIPPIPISFGFAGTVVLGQRRFRIAAKLGADDIVLLAEVNELPIFALPVILKQFGIDLGPLDVLKKIDIKFEKLAFKFAPLGGMIGELYFDPGISAEGIVIVKVPGVINTRAEAGLNIGLPSGFKAYAKMPNTTIGPLKLSGAGKDRKYGTADDGPIFYMALGLMEQRIYISAMAELLGNKGLVDVNITLTSINFKMLLYLLGVLDVEVFAESYVDIKDANIGLRCSGKTKLGDAELKLLGDIGTRGFMFAGQLKSLSLRDFLVICNKMGAKIPKKMVPKFGLSDVELLMRAKI